MSNVDLWEICNNYPHLFANFFLLVDTNPLGWYHKSIAFEEAEK
jgi:hypothetical protein